MPFNPFQDLTANALNAIFDRIMEDPTTTSASGSATAVLNTEVLDAVLGTYVFTAVAGRRYRYILSGAKMSGTSGTLAEFMIRDGGGSTPTSGSTLLGQAAAYIPATGGAGQITCYVSGTFTPSAGTRTLGVFTVSRAGTAAVTPVGTRELYVEDIGPNPAP
jgi:hypothetical protein